MIVCGRVTPCMSCGFAQAPQKHISSSSKVPASPAELTSHSPTFLLFSFCPLFFYGPLPCLHLSDPVITADPSLDLSTAKEITPKAAEHIGLPVWRVCVCVWRGATWSPDADKLARGFEIQEGPAGRGRVRCVWRGVL